MCVPCYLCGGGGGLSLRRGDRYLNGLFVVLVNTPRLVNESPSSLSESEGVVVVVVSSSLYPYTSPLSLYQPKPLKQFGFQFGYSLFMIVILFILCEQQC